MPKKSLSAATNWGDYENSILIDIDVPHRKFLDNHNNPTITHHRLPNHACSPVK